MRFKFSLEKVSKYPLEATLEDILTLLSCSKKESYFLFKKADALRKEHWDKKIFIRGIIEISNICQNHCLYCGLREKNKNIKRYKMNLEEIIKASQDIFNKGIKTVVLQSGESQAYSRDEIIFLLEQIKKKTKLSITLSLGVKSYEDLELFKRAGASRYLLKHETSDKTLFSKLCPFKNLEQRLDCLKQLKNLGYKIGSGMMVGLPSQTDSILAKDILLLQKMQVFMAGIGVFIPHEATPLAKYKAGSFLKSLKVLAITRLILPKAYLPATTAMASIAPYGLIWALKSGANAIMPNMTPLEYRSLYSIYPGKIGVFLNPEDNWQRIKNLILALDYTWN